MPADKEKFTLYDGRVVLEYTDKTHRYRASVNGEKFKHTANVTTILNVLNKPAIAEWACRMCCDYIEENLRRLIAGNSFSEAEVFKIVEMGRSAHDRAREEAAGIGTSAHDWLRDHWRAIIRKTDSPLMLEEEKPKKCIGAALDFFKEHKMVPVAVEEPLYSLTYNICGRPDWIGYVDDEFAIVDYKSTKKLWPECPIQMCIYAKLYEEMKGNLPKVRWGLRMDKETGEFDGRRYLPEEFDADWDTSLAIYKIYDRFKTLRRVPKKEKEDFLALL